ncbi:DUF2306 domain-containing protein [Phreatobacter sp.]|uniref:DUF2306 domain-containing protein n=1 Tax=Phreatobacter sp. TaxID=1966341 RepID=UPI0022CB702E|nr:DUF2306 domain-containing protein [Phreatobacter sp.]MCZ8314756.1 DUF2306 domain-containing protein [Phreatobacter sp.]
MTLAPLLAAPLAIQLHAIAAVALIPLTIVQLGRRKSGTWHRRVGWAWVVLMTITAVSSFWIHGIRLFGPFSPIHILSVVTLVTLVHAIVARRTGNMRGHRLGMLGVAMGWAGAGLFTLLPGRIMGQVVFGG